MDDKVIKEFRGRCLKCHIDMVLCRLSLPEGELADVRSQVSALLDNYLLPRPIPSGFWHRFWAWFRV